MFHSSMQLLLVLSAHWDASVGTLYCFSQGELVAAPIPVSLGEKGMAWGKGLHPLQEAPLVKQEGDRRSPAGVFHLGPCFGYEFEGISFPCIPIDEELECVDDPDSRYYNRFVKSSQEDKDWKSSEVMKEVGDLYNLGMVVQHNMDPIVPGAGSCIFIHKWRAEGDSTAGCTALAEEKLSELLSWLDPSCKPLLIQLPLQAYEALREPWGLPDICP